MERFTRVFRRLPCRPFQGKRITFRCLYLPFFLFLTGFVYFNAQILNNPALNNRDNAGFNGLPIRHALRHLELAEAPKSLQQTFKNTSTSSNKTSAYNLLGRVKQGYGIANRRMIANLSHVVQVKQSEIADMLKNLSLWKYQRADDWGNKSLHRRKAPARIRMKQPIPNRKKVVPVPKNIYSFMVDGWKSQKDSFCNGDFQSFSSLVFFLKNVLVTKSLAIANATGGEDILSVKDRPETDEVYKYKPGFFTLHCNSSRPVVPMKGKTYIPAWFKSLKFVNKPPERDVLQNSIFTIAIVRIEYANVFWALIDIYNGFLTLSAHGKDRMETHMLLVDAKPWTHLDNMWTTFFGSVSRLSQLPEKVYFKEMVWNFERKYCPVLMFSANLTLHKEFRNEMLRAYGLSERAKAEPSVYNNCSTLGRPFKVLFVWRRNYLAHPRNPTGIVARKISNEDELLNVTKHALKNCDIKGVQLDLLSIREQLTLVSGSDVMIGMHGAALAFSWFLPPGSGVIEMFPATHRGNWHMAQIAQRNEVFYNKWVNRDRKNERVHAQSTRIPPEIVVKLIDDMIKVICHQKNKPIDLNNNTKVVQKSKKTKSLMKIIKGKKSVGAKRLKNVPKKGIK